MLTSIRNVKPINCMLLISVSPCCLFCTCNQAMMAEDQEFINTPYSRTSSWRHKSFIPLRENYQAVSIQDYSTRFLLHMGVHCVFEVSVWQPNFIKSFVLQNKGVVSIAKGQPGLIPYLPHVDVSLKFLHNRFKLIIRHNRIQKTVG